MLITILSVVWHDVLAILIPTATLLHINVFQNVHLLLLISPTLSPKAVSLSVNPVTSPKTQRVDVYSNAPKTSLTGLTMTPVPVFQNVQIIQLGVTTKPKNVPLNVLRHLLPMLTT